MRAAVTRGGQLVVAEVADVSPGSGHVVVRSLAAGICGSDLHALADFSHFTGLMDSVGVPALDPAADCVFGHEFCAEIVEHGPDTARDAPRGHPRSAPCPSSWGPRGSSRSATPTITPAPWPSTWPSKRSSSSRFPTPSTPTWPR